jgi:AcrR family transcriptional regulator
MTLPDRHRRQPPPVPSIEEAIFAHLQPAAARRLLLSAHQVFADKGYHAATTREIAAGAGMSPAAMYIHYHSKQDLLFQLSLLGHEACEQMVNAALQTVDPPEAQLPAVVGAFAGWHAAHHTTARIVHYELTSLTRDNFDAVAAVRRRIDRVIASVIERGAAAGVFRLTDLPGTALAITSMGVDVARWFPAGTLHSPLDVQRLYADLALRLVGHRAG